MTKKLEEFFNLPPLEAEEETPIAEIPESELSLPPVQDLTTAQKVELALPVVTGLEKHDNEMDEIAKKAIDTFEDLVALGGNVPDMHAGKIFEVAGQMLKTALEAKNAKAEKKLRMVELQLKKVRSEQIDMENGNMPMNSTAGEFDRNELIKQIVLTKSENSDK